MSEPYSIETRIRINELLEAQERIAELERQIAAGLNCDKHYGFLTGREKAEYYFKYADIFTALAPNDPE